MQSFFFVDQWYCLVVSGFESMRWFTCEISYGFWCEDFLYLTEFALIYRGKLSPHISMSYIAGAYIEC